jgi:hypothetical protein
MIFAPVRPIAALGAASTKKSLHRRGHDPKLTFEAGVPSVKADG